MKLSTWQTWQRESNLGIMLEINEIYLLAELRQLNTRYPPEPWKVPGYLVELRQIHNKYNNALLLMDRSISASNN